MSSPTSTNRLRANRMKRPGSSGHSTSQRVPAGGIAGSIYGQQRAVSTSGQKRLSVGGNYSMGNVNSFAADPSNRSSMYTTGKGFNRNGGFVNSTTMDSRPGAPNNGSSVNTGVTHRVPNVDVVISDTTNRGNNVQSYQYESDRNDINGISDYKGFAGGRDLLNRSELHSRSKFSESEFIKLDFFPQQTNKQTRLAGMTRFPPINGVGGVTGTSIGTFPVHLGYTGQLPSSGSSKSSPLKPLASPLEKDLKLESPSAPMQKWDSPFGAKESPHHGMMIQSPMIHEIEAPMRISTPLSGSLVNDPSKDSVKESLLVMKDMSTKASPVSRLDSPIMKDIGMDRPGGSEANKINNMMERCQKNWNSRERLVDNHTSAELGHDLQDHQQSRTWTDLNPNARGTDLNTRATDGAPRRGTDGRPVSNKLTKQELTQIVEAQLRNLNSSQHRKYFGKHGRKQMNATKGSGNSAKKDGNANAISDFKKELANANTNEKNMLVIDRNSVSTGNDSVYPSTGNPGTIFHDRKYITTNTSSSASSSSIIEVVDGNVKVEVNKDGGVSPLPNRDNLVGDTMAKIFGGMSAQDERPDGKIPTPCDSTGGHLANNSSAIAMEGEGKVNVTGEMLRQCECYGNVKKESSDAIEALDAKMADTNDSNTATNASGNITETPGNNTDTNATDTNASKEGSTSECEAEVASRDAVSDTGRNAALCAEADILFINQITDVITHFNNQASSTLQHPGETSSNLRQLGSSSKTDLLANKTHTGQMIPSARPIIDQATAAVGQIGGEAGAKPGRLQSIDVTQTSKDSKDSERSSRTDSANHDCSPNPDLKFPFKMDGYRGFNAAPVGAASSVGAAGATGSSDTGLTVNPDKGLPRPHPTKPLSAADSFSWKLSEKMQELVGPKTVNDSHISSRPSHFGRTEAISSGLESISNRLNSITGTIGEQHRQGRAEGADRVTAADRIASIMGERMPGIGTHGTIERTSQEKQQLVQQEELKENQKTLLQGLVKAKFLTKDVEIFSTASPPPTPRGKNFPKLDAQTLKIINSVTSGKQSANGLAGLDHAKNSLLLKRLADNMGATDVDVTSSDYNSENEKSSSSTNDVWAEQVDRRNRGKPAESPVTPSAANQTPRSASVSGVAGGKAKGGDLCLTNFSSPEKCEETSKDGSNEGSIASRSRLASAQSLSKSVKKTGTGTKAKSKRKEKTKDKESLDKTDVGDKDKSDRVIAEDYLGVDLVDENGDRIDLDQKADRDSEDSDSEEDSNHSEYQLGQDMIIGQDITDRTTTATKESSRPRKKKTRKQRILLSRHPQSSCISLVQSCFPQILTPTLYFEYPNGILYPRHDKTHPRIFKNLDPTAIPVMYWNHTSRVHVYNCVTNTLKKGGLYYQDCISRKTRKKDSISNQMKEAPVMRHIGKNFYRFSLIWSTHLKPEKLKEFHMYQKTNHFPFSWYLGRKDLMCKSIGKMRRTFPQAFDITPQTFVLPDDGKKFIDAVKNSSYYIPKAHPSSNQNSNCNTPNTSTTPGGSGVTTTSLTLPPGYGSSASAFPSSPSNPITQKLLQKSNDLSTSMINSIDRAAETAGMLNPATGNGGMLSVNNMGGTSGFPSVSNATASTDSKNRRKSGNPFLVDGYSNIVSISLGKSPKKSTGGLLVGTSPSKSSKTPSVSSTTVGGSSITVGGESVSIPMAVSATARASTAVGGKRKSLWISKPVAASCGKGVRIIGSHTSGIEKLAKRSLVVQKYIDPPLLINGYKFDLRLYVVVTSYDPLRIYLFKEGLVRFATQKYSTKSSDLKCKKVHLTNYSINKNDASYVKNMDNEKVSSSDDNMDSDVETGKKGSSANKEKNETANDKPIVAKPPATTGITGTSSSMIVTNVALKPSSSSSSSTSLGTAARGAVGGNSLTGNPDNLTGAVTPSIAGRPADGEAGDDEDNGDSTGEERGGVAEIISRVNVRGKYLSNKKKATGKSPSNSKGKVTKAKNNANAANVDRKDDTTEDAGTKEKNDENDDENNETTDNIDANQGDQKETKQEKNDKESKWSLTELETHFKEQGWDWPGTYAEIKALLVKSIMSVESIIVSMLQRSCVPAGHSPCFEIYGFDVLIDAYFKPWLLEVNVSPSLSSSSPLDRRIKTMLLSDVMTMIGIKPFDCGSSNFTDKKKRLRNEQLNKRRTLFNKNIQSFSQSFGSTVGTVTSGRDGVGVLNGTTGGRERDHCGKETNSQGGRDYSKMHDPIRDPKLREILQGFGDSEWTLILETIDEVYRAGYLEPLYPRSREAVETFSEYLQTPRLANKILNLFYLCGGETLLTNKSEQHKWGLEWLIKNNIHLKAPRV